MSGDRFFMTLDSNIVIAYLNGEQTVMDQMTEWRKEGNNFFLPVMVEAEVLSFSGMTPVELARAEKFMMENFILIPLDRWLVRIAAAFRREHKLKLPDATIAASAFITKTPLVTRNVKDFRKIPGIRLLTI